MSPHDHIYSQNFLLFDSIIISGVLHLVTQIDTGIVLFFVIY